MRFILAVCVIFMSSVTHAAHKKNEVMIITDLTDVIYMYHELSRSTITPKKFLANVEIGTSLAWGKSKFSNMARGYRYTENVFKQKKILKAASREIPKHKPDFKGQTIGIWKYVELSPFDFDKRSFSVKYPDKTSVNCNDYHIVWDYPTEQSEYIVETTDEAKRIEKVSVRASKRGLSRKRALPALFLFNIDNTFERDGDNYTKLKLKTVKVYKTDTKRISFNEEEDLLFHYMVNTTRQQ